MEPEACASCATGNEGMAESVFQGGGELLRSFLVVDVDDAEAAAGYTQADANIVLVVQIGQIFRRHVFNSERLPLIQDWPLSFAGNVEKGCRSDKGENFLGGHFLKSADGLLCSRGRGFAFSPA